MPSTGRQRAFVRIVGAVAMALSASACVPQSMGRVDEPTTPFVTDQVRLSHDVAFLPGATDLSPADTAGLDRFLAQVQPEHGDTVDVVAHGSLGFLRANGVQSALTAYGVDSRRIDMGTSPRDVVTVTVTRTVYMPTSCVTPRETVYDYTGGVSVLPSPRCSNDLNLARMIADPEDLVRGRPIGPAEGVYHRQPVRTYRDAEGDEATDPIEGAGLIVTLSSD